MPSVVVISAYDVSNFAVSPVANGHSAGCPHFRRKCLYDVAIPYWYGSLGMEVGVILTPTSYNFSRSDVSPWKLLERYHLVIEVAGNIVRHFSRKAQHHPSLS